jgi:hypothetical protein
MPNGHIQKPQLLLLFFASKILVEVNGLLKLQDNTPLLGDEDASDEDGLKFSAR